MILGFGLNGILTAMPPTLRHEYLAKENSFTSMAMLLGLSANLAGKYSILLQLTNIEMKYILKGLAILELGRSLVFILGRCCLRVLQNWKFRD